METAIYLTTGVLTVVWSVLLYRWWEDRAHLRDESGLRLLLLVSPSSYFLLVAVSGWSTVANFRLDLVALEILDGLMVLCAAVMVLLGGFRSMDKRGAYIGVVIAYNVIAALLAGAALFVRSFPPLIVQVASIVGQWNRLDFFSFSWFSAPEANKQLDLVRLLNRIFIALLSYVPIGILRGVSNARQRRRLRHDVDLLHDRIERLERLLASQEKGEESPQAPSSLPSA